MTIRIERNAAGNCLTFHGQTNPVYYNACLSAEVVDNEYVNIINDIASNENETRYEYYRLHFSEFQSADFNTFSDAQSAVDYINQVGNVRSQNDAVIFGPEDTIDFQLDATSTSVIFDNGDHKGVNSIKAVALDNGLISIQAMLSDHEFYQLPHTGCTIHGDAIPGGLNDVVDALNEYFTVGAFEQVVIRDPYSTMVADVDGTIANGSLVGALALDPAGTDIGASSGTHNNKAGWLSTDTIDQAGEYFTFDIRVRGQIGFGLVHSDDSYNDGHYPSGTNTTYADPSTFCNGVNSSHYGWQFSHHFHPSPNGPWTNYGGNTSYVQGPGWSSTTKRFSTSDEATDWQNGDPVKMKVGLDANSFIEVAYYDVSESEWIMCARSAYPVEEGAEFKLGIKFPNSTVRLHTTPKIHLLEPAAPTMNFRYIESPDGVFQYPLFATEEEANYYDQNHDGTTGSGTSSIQIFADDPTNTQWYAPDTGYTNNASSAPSGNTFMSNPINWTEVTSLVNADLVPPTFTAEDLTVDELSAVNYQTQPADTPYITTITGLPSGLTDGGSGVIIGTAPEVSQDLVTNPSDTYTVTVTRTNSYGSSTGTFDIIVNNLTPVPTAVSGFTHIGTSATMVDSDTLADGSAVTIDNVLEDGKRIVFSRSWMETYVRDTLQTGTNQKIFIGIASGSANWSSIDTPDFVYGFQFEKGSTANGLYVRKILNGSVVSNITYSVFANDLVFYHDHSVSGYMMANLPNGGQGASVATPTYTNNEYGSVGSGDQTFVIASVGTTMDLDTNGISEVDNPVVSTSLTNWSKALDFSGSSERAVKASSHVSSTPIQQGLSNTVSGSSNSNTTSPASSARPWATAIVFQTDGNSTNQHIWNQGEGANSSDDNIYLRTDSSRRLHFGWGQSGALNEFLIHPDTTGSGWRMTAGHWYGIYIGYTGERLSGADATAANLSDCFDIRLMGSSANWATAGYADTNLMAAADWTSTGGRMDRTVGGDFTIGGRGSNRSFHGKVASMVVTTLKLNTAMPNAAEIEMMITDPMQWIQDYKVGEFYRLPQQGSNVSNFQTANTSGVHTPANATQVWLMGDGSNDSYSNMIRNQVNPADQNYNKLNMISMVSNDIQNVTIPGLS